MSQTAAKDIKQRQKDMIESAKKQLQQKKKTLQQVEQIYATLGQCLNMSQQELDQLANSVLPSFQEDPNIVALAKQLEAVQDALYGRIEKWDDEEKYELMGCMAENQSLMQSIVAKLNRSKRVLVGMCKKHECQVKQNKAKMQALLSYDPIKKLGPGATIAQVKQVNQELARQLEKQKADIAMLRREREGLDVVIQAINELEIDD